MRKAIVCALLLSVSLPAGGQENVAGQNTGASYQTRGAGAGGGYSQTEIDAKLGQIGAELINLREVNTLRTESVAREAEDARAYIDRVLLIAVVMLAVIMYLLINGFRHQMNNQALRLRRMLKEGETLMADVERLLNRPDVENYRASRKLSEIKAQLKESSDRMLPQLSVRNIYEVASDPNLPAVLFVQAKAIKAEQTGDWRGAAAHWEEVISLDPKDPDNYLHLAHTYRNLSRSVTGDEHEAFLQKSLAYYQEYANRTKGLHDAFAQHAPPPPSDILAEQIRTQQQQAVQQQRAAQAPPSRGPITAYRPAAYTDDSVMFQTAIPVAVPQAPQPATSWWKRKPAVPQPVQVFLQPMPAPGEQPVQAVQAVQAEQPMAVQPQLQPQPAVAAQQTAMLSVVPAAAPVQARPARKPLLNSVKRTAGSIGNSAERTINRGMTALRSVAQTLSEGRRQQKEGISVFSAGAEGSDVSAVDAAMSETGVAQAEITAGRQPFTPGGPRLARRIPLPGAGGQPRQPVNGGGSKSTELLQTADAPAELARQADAADAAHADSNGIENAEAVAGNELSATDVQEPREPEASALAGEDDGHESGEPVLELEPPVLPEQGAPEPSVAKSNGRKAVAKGAPAANGKTNGGAPKPEALQSGDSDLPVNGEATLEHGMELFNRSVELSEKDQAKALKLLEEVIGIYEQVHANGPESSDLCKAWGFALVAKAMAPGNGRQKGTLFREAADKLMEGNLISDSKHENDFTIASVYALAGDEKRCRKWLEESRDAGTLNTDALRTVPEFAKMRGKPWFNKYLDDTAS